MLQLAKSAQQLAADVEQHNDQAIAADVQQLANQLGSEGLTFDGGRASVTLGPAIGMTLFEVERGKMVYPDFGGGGVQLAVNAWKASDGNFRLHVGLETLVGGGTVNGIPTSSAIVGLTLGFGGFEHVPLFAVGPAVRIPLDDEPVSFTMIGSASMMSVLATF